jgi:hypothetical protein
VAATHVEEIVRPEVVIRRDGSVVRKLGAVRTFWCAWHRG